MKDHEKQDIRSIQKTAATIVDLANNSDVAYAKDIVNLITRQYGPINSFAPELGSLVVSRYLTSEQILGHYKKPQVVELGAGFSPHSINLHGLVDRYIECDLPINSEIKRELVRQLNQQDKTIYIAGDVLESRLWQEITGALDRDKPLVIFSEGLILYFDETMRDQLALHAKSILTKPEDSFVFDDSLGYHPELSTDKRLKEAMDKIKVTSKSNVYGGFRTQKEAESQWKSRGFNVNRHPYVIANPNLADILGNFKSFILQRGDLHD